MAIAIAFMIIDMKVSTQLDNQIAETLRIKKDFEALEKEISASIKEHGGFGPVGVLEIKDNLNINHQLAIAVSSQGFWTRFMVAKSIGKNNQKIKTSINLIRIYLKLLDREPVYTQAG